jgi:uncharacterized protein YegP (UPF0339 family)
MRKVVFGGFVLAVLVLARGAAPESVVAQGKKPAVKAAAGGIEIREGKDGKFRFFVQDADDNMIAMSRAYATAKDAEEAIAHMKAIVSTAKVTMGAKKASKTPKDEK